MNQLNLDVLQEEYKAICELYWELDAENKFVYKVSEIAELVGLKTSQISSIVKKSCIAYSNTIQCEICDAAYELTRRSDYDSHRRLYFSWKCNSCLSEEKEREMQNRNQQIITFISSTKKKPFDIGEITLKEAVYLLSFIRHSGNEMLTGFNAVAMNRTEQLMPQPGREEELIEALYSSGLISLSHDSPHAAFYFEDGDLTAFSLVDSIWQLELQDGDSLGNILRELEDLLSAPEYFEVLSEEFYELIVDISLMECLAFLEYNLKEHKLPFRAGDKTRNVFLQVLKTHSVAQAYVLILRACKDAAAYYMQGGIYKQQAANSVVGRIQKYYERAIANRWTIDGFRRNYNLPQSVLSQVIFNFILGTDDGGFNQKINSLI